MNVVRACLPWRLCLDELLGAIFEDIGKVRSSDLEIKTLNLETVEWSS